MPVPILYKYRCIICGKVFEDKSELKAKEKARHCEQNHDMVYIPLMRSDVQRLWSFLMTGNRDYLTKTLVNTIKSYRTLK